MDENSPRWLMRLPGTIYGLVWIGIGVVAVAIYAWVTYGPLRLQGTRAHAVGLVIFMVTMGPLVVLLAKSRFRAFALKWERYADLKDAEENVSRLLEEYGRTHDDRRLRKARRVVRRLRRRHPDPVYGQSLEESVERAAVLDRE